MGNTTAPRRPWGWFAVVLLGFALIGSAPLTLESDGLVRLGSLNHLLSTGRPDDARYSLIGPLFAAPLWLLGQSVGHVDEAVWAFNRVVVLTAVPLMLVALRPVLPAGERRRFLLVLLFASMFPWHVQGFFGEVFQTAALGFGLALAVVRGGWWGWVGWPVAVLGAANTPPAVVGLGLAAAVVTWHRGRLRYLLAPAAAAGLVMLENLVRRGDPLAGGYDGDRGLPTPLPYSGQPGFSYPFVFGVLAVLFSFGKGLVFFVPALFLRFPHVPGDAPDLGLLYRAWVAVVVGLVLVYARWWAWYGGVCWGPRFFLFACLPSALVLARYASDPGRRPLRANALALAALLLSAWGAAAGLVYAEHGADRYWSERDYSFEHVLWYVPEGSVLWLPFVDPKALDADDCLRLLGCGVGVAYLAWPLARAVAGQSVRRLSVAWAARPRFRL